MRSLTPRTRSNRTREALQSPDPRYPSLLPTGPTGKWSDDNFLNALRGQGDPAADAAVARLVANHGSQAVGPIFRLLQANDNPLPADAPQALKDFMANSAGLPPGINPDRLPRGSAAFLKNALPSVIVLLSSSLPRGYGAPCLCEILSISRDLERHPFGRLMGVVQLLVNISAPNAFDPRGRAIVTAQKLRLLHAGIRSMAARYRPHYQQQFGVPVNHEDMLATIMGFSYLLIDGIRRLDLELAPDEAEDLYYLWRTFALLMGIHPDGQPHDDSYIPANLTEAAEFYSSYVRRNNTPASRNRYGSVLARDNLKMMEGLLPRSARLFGLGYAPRISMTELLTPEELARVGVRPVVGHRLIKMFLRALLMVGQRTAEHAPFVSGLARIVLQGMVDADRRGEVSFAIPLSRLQLRGSSFE